MKRAIQVLAISGLLGAPRSDYAANQVSLPLSECQLESSLGVGAVTARCGWFEVPENREIPSGKHIRIHVAVVPALRRQALPDPVVILSGGPGQAASDFYLASGHAFEPLRRERDLVIVDQRGTGKSNRLDCTFPDDLEAAKFDAELLKSESRRCLAELAGDPHYYTTSVAVRDLEEIRIALGYAQFNLYGTSYGTRVAQHYIRRYAQAVRSVILDGVVPVELALGPEVAPAAQRALDAILERCLRQNECQSKFPAIKDELSRLRDRLARAPLALTLVDPTTAKSAPFEFSAMHLAAALRLHSYNDETASLLPYLIHEAAQGRAEPLAAQSVLVAHDLSEQLATGMHNAVVCTEDVPYFTSEAIKDPAIDKSYLSRVFLESIQAMCSVWPKGSIDDDFHAPLASDIPALLLSGESDPVTPSNYGERSARDFRRGKHLVVPGQGHGQLKNPCIARIMTRFVERASSESLDVKCVEKQAATPFMLNAMSPGP